MIDYMKMKNNDRTKLNNEKKTFLKTINLGKKVVEVAKNRSEGH